MKRLIAIALLCVGSAGCQLRGGQGEVRPTPEMEAILEDGPPPGHTCSNRAIESARPGGWCYRPASP